MYAIIFALLSYFGWGSGDIFSALASRKIGTFPVAFWTFFLGFILLSFLTPLFLKDLAKFTLEMFLIATVLSVLLFIAWPIFLEALRIGNTSIVGTISGSYGGLVVVLSTIFLNEKLIAIQIFAIIIILTGVVLASLNFKALKNKKFIENRGTVFAIIAMIIWGIYFTFVRIPVEEIGWFWTSYIAVVTGSLLMVATAIFKRKKITKIPSKQYRNIGLSTFLTTTGTVSYNFAITQGLTAVVAPIATSYPTLFVILSRFVFGDKLNKQQWIGIILSLAGIVLLAIFS